MGVKGLYTHVTFNKNAYDVIDLVQEARIKGGIEILLDFGAFRRYINEVILKIIIHKFKNPYLSLLCSEYDIYSEAHLQFHKSFADAGITLVWIIDSSKGLDSEVSKQKNDVWMERRCKTRNLVDDLMEGCNLKIPLDTLENIRPLYHIDPIIDMLKKSGAEIINLLQGGSDEYIASEFKRRKSYAILTDDTDFLIFPDCEIIFLNSMKTEYRDDLFLPFIDIESSDQIFKKPEKFLSRIFTQRKLIELFEMNKQEQLVILSILKGNDNTIDYSHMLQVHLNLKKDIPKWPKMDKVVKYIIDKNINFENIFTIPKIMEFLENYPEVRGSFVFCLNFYTLKHFQNQKDEIVFNPSSATNSLTDYLRRKLTDWEIGYKTYAIHLGFYHDTIVAENLNDSTSITTVLLPIRSKIYPYILDENEDQILEKRNRESQDLIPIIVKHALIKTNKIIGKPESESERQNGVVYGIDLFEEIWSHLEDNKSLNFINRFGYEIGFICYILRYFYKITNNINIKLSIEEFTALFAAIFYQYGISTNIKFNTRLNRDRFMEMKICPSERCFIILGWFTEVFYHGKHLTGDCLNLTKYFPSINHLISSSAYTAFYENAVNPRNGRLSHLNKSIHESIANLEKQILKEFNKEYEIIIL